MPAARAGYEGFEHHANRYPATASMAPSERNPMTSGVIALLPQAAPGAQTRVRRYLTNTIAAPTRQMTAAIIKAMRWGAAMMAMPASQALPRPRLARNAGIAPGGRNKGSLQLWYEQE